MGVLLVCLVAVIFLQLTEGKICDQESEFKFFDPDNPDAEETCQKCPKCQPGQGLAVQCGSQVPYGTFTGCKKCEVDKTYSENNDISDCKPCNECGFKIVLRQCTLTQNSKCADTCIPGYKLHPIIDACQVVPGTTEHPIDSQVSKQVLFKILGGCLGGVVIIMVFIGLIIYFANHPRHRSESCNDLERESVPADNEQSTGDDSPNLDVQRIPEDCVVSDMEELRKNNQVMLHSIQKKLDVRETTQQKTWRGVGRALGVSSEDLNLIETQFYQALQSPTEALVALLKTRNQAEPSMREFVRALIACGRSDVARIIIDWPWWEMTGDRLRNDSS